MSLSVSVQTETNNLLISIQYPRSVANLSYNFQMHLSVFEQQLPALQFKKVYEHKFYAVKTSVKVEALEYAKNYKVSVRAKGGDSEWLEKNVFTYTPIKPQSQLIQEVQEQQLNELPQWRQYAKRSASSSGFHQSRQNESQYINSRLTSQIDQKFNKSSVKRKELSNSELMLKMVGQTCPIVDQRKLQKYIMDGRKCRNMKQFINESQKVFDRRKVLQKKVLLAHGISIFGEIYKNKDGMSFFKNDWNMGPFYSYDLNESQIRKD